MMRWKRGGGAEDIQSLASEECQGYIIDQYIDNADDEDENLTIMGHNDSWTVKHASLESIISNEEEYEIFNYIDDDFGFFTKASVDTGTMSPNQMYMLKKYQSKAMNPDDDTGGYRSLCGYAIGDKKTASIISATPKQANLIFRLNSVLLNKYTISFKIKKEPFGSFFILKSF